MAVPVSAEPDISIVLPCYNEASHLAHSIGEISHTMSHLSCQYEVILVDDGSTDATRALIQRLAAAHDFVRVFFHERNLGRGAAVKTGLLAARAPIAGFLDTDLEVHSRYIPAMIQAVEDGADVVCGERTYKIPLSAYDLYRELLSRGYRTLVRHLLKLKVKDSEAGYKFFNMPRARRLIEMTRDDGWFWDTEVMATAQIRGLNIAEVPMVYVRNPEKSSTVKPIRDSLRYLQALSAFHRRHAVSLTYTSPLLYNTLMRILYRSSYDERYEAITRLIPEGASVLDVCCGDARLFTSHLKNKHVDYVGLDINRTMAARAKTAGADMRTFDIELRDDLPKADFVVMQGSLYQFIPSHGSILKKLAAASRRALIITEPVRNWTSSTSLPARIAGKTLTNPGTGPKAQRFTPESLDGALKPYEIRKRETICGGREMIFVVAPS
jgi:glycosyltransferase involved in cell wall biosynthesis